MRIAYRAVAAAASLLTCDALLAADDDSAAWGIASAAGRFEPAGEPSRWRYNVIGQWRNFDRGSGADQYLLRGGVGYDLNPTMTLWGGYDYFLTDPNALPTRDEHRFWQQFSWDAASWDWGALSLYARLEQRNLERSNDVGLALRQFVQLTVPVPAQDITVVSWIEHFINLNDTDYGGRTGFAELRSYVGVRMPMTEYSALEAGYMNQLLNRSAERDAVNHTAMLHLRLSF